jgi:hypothetical protein
VIIVAAAEPLVPRVMRALPARSGGVCRGEQLRHERVDAYEHQAFFVCDVASHGQLKIHPIIPAAVSLSLKRKALRDANKELFSAAGITSIEVILRPEWPSDRFEIWDRMIEFSGGDLATTRQFREPPAAMEGLHIIGVRWQAGARMFRAVTR